MAYPKQSEIELPILLEVEAAGGEIRPNPAFFREIATYFPALSQEDLRATNRTGINTWENKVHWARLRLVHKGDLDKSRYGVWRMTGQGRERIKGEVGDIAQVRREEGERSCPAWQKAGGGRNDPGEVRQARIKGGALQLRRGVERCRVAATGDACL